MWVTPFWSLIAILFGNSNLSQKLFTQGPAPITTCSHSIVPFDVTTPVTEVDATSAAAPCSLADGSDGQIKTIINVSTSGTNAITITPSNLRGYTTITLNAQGETVTCMFKNSNWNVIAGNGYTLA